MLSAKEATHKLFEVSLHFNGDVCDAVNKILTVLDVKIQKEILMGGNSVVAYFEHSCKEVRKMVCEELKNFGYLIDYECAMENGIFYVTWERENIDDLIPDLLNILDAEEYGAAGRHEYARADEIYKLKLAYIKGEVVLDPHAEFGIRMESENKKVNLRKENI